MGDAEFDQGEEDFLNMASRCLHFVGTTWWLSEQEQGDQIGHSSKEPRALLRCQSS